MTIGTKLLGPVALLFAGVTATIGSDSGMQALSLGCIAVMHNGSERALVDHYRQSTLAKQHACVDDLVRSLTPAPTYTAADIRELLTKDRLGGYQLVTTPPEINGRIYINELAARGIVELTVQHLIQDPKVIPPLIECVDHPIPTIADYCNLALQNLTRRDYNGELMWAQHRPLVDEWRAWWAVLEHGHPLFDEFLANECRATIRDIFVRIARAQRVGGEPVLPYLEDKLLPYREGVNNPRLNLDSGWSGTLFEYDVGKHNTDFWPAKKTTRITLVMRRAGNPNLDRRLKTPSPQTEMKAAASQPLLHEQFSRLDIDVSFSIDTTDGQIRQAALTGVHEALGRLRDLDGSGK